MESHRQDQILVQECLQGNQDAWSALIDKYKNLIFSIPVKRGFSSDGARDVFQAVCLALVSELPRLREPRALAAWLIQTTSHKCLRAEVEGRRYSKEDESGDAPEGESPKTPDELLRELESEQLVREAVSELSAECRRMLEAFFYQTPAASYTDVASALDIPKGSVGPTRNRCLEKLRQLLEGRGF